MFTNKDVMDLRAKTGVGMMDCKKALTEAEGDMEKAIELLREKGMATAAKRAEKIASQGIVASYVDGNVGVLVEVNCESDFVARGDQFKDFVAAVATQIAATKPCCVDTLMSQKFVNGNLTITDMLNEAISKIGEKINIRRFERYDIAGVADGLVDTYIHMGGKIGVMVELSDAHKNDDAKELIHDIALQIAAANPTYIRVEQVPQDEIIKEKEILKAQALNEPKPKPMNIIDKMVEGRISKYYKEVCLLEQPFVKESEKAIKDLMHGANVVKFIRFEMGEGLAKKNEDLSSEVEAQIAAMKK